MFETPVQVPNFSQAIVPQVDTSGLGNLFQSYFQGQQQRRALQIQNAPQDTANPDGTPNYGGLINRYLMLGDMPDAGSLMQLGIRQQALSRGGSLDDPLGRGGAPAAPAAAGFGPSVNRTLGFEGGLDPRDTNGTPTNFGINQAANPDVDVKNLTSDQARALYKTRYWDSIGADSLSPALQGMAFDTSVIAGPQRAKDILARSGGDPAKFMDLREAFQSNLLQSDPQKYGAYADAWSKRNAALRAGTGTPASASAYAGQPQAAPAQAAISGATGSAPYQIASLGPTAAPSAPASPAPQPATPQPSFGAIDGRPTANNGQPQVVTPAEWAAKFNPADTGLAQKIADAIGVDQGEGIDVQDSNIRRAVVPVLMASRRIVAQGQPGASVGDEGRSQDNPPLTTHPWGPQAATGDPNRVPYGYIAPSSRSPGAGGASLANLPNGAPGSPVGPATAPASQPVGFQSNAAPVRPAAGPDTPGLPAGYQQPGGGQQYVNDILTMAAQYQDAGLEGRAKAYMARAQQVAAQLEAAQKSALDLQTHNAELTPEQKNFGVMRDQYGFTGSPLDLQAEQERHKAAATAQGRNMVITPAEKEARDAGFSSIPAFEAAKGAAVEEAKGQAGYLGGLPKQLAADADTARQTSSSVDQMLSAAQGFRMGSGAQMDQSTRKILQGIFTRLGVDDPALSSSTATYEDFSKIAGVLNRQAAKSVGGRTGYQEMQLIGSTLPSAEMTYDGFRGVASSLKGTADYQIARQQASQDWLADPSHGNSLYGFDADFNRNTSPAAFWLARLQTDQPDLFTSTVQRLGQTAQGRALLTKAKAGMSWANGNGLLGQ